MQTEHDSRPVIASWQGVSKSFGPVRALDGFELELHAGEVLALVGANGAGKTTAIACLLGQAKVDSGAIGVFGHAPGSTQARTQIGVMLQHLSLAPMIKVGEHLKYFSALHAEPLNWQDCLRQTGLSELTDRRYDRLSGGQQRRVQFALALLGRPRLLVLDEPTVALDPVARQEFWQHVTSLVRSGLSVLLTTHQMEEAEAVADRIAVVHAGRVLAAESIGDLRARAGCQRIACVTQCSDDSLRALPGVQTVQHDGQRVLIYTQTAEATARALLQLDPGLSALEITRPGLIYSVQTLLAAA